MHMVDLTIVILGGHPSSSFQLKTGKHDVPMYVHTRIHLLPLTTHDIYIYVYSISEPAGHRSEWARLQGQTGFPPTAVDGQEIPQCPVYQQCKENMEDSAWEEADPNDF